MTQLMEVRRRDGATFLIPSQWGRLPEGGVHAAPVPVAGGLIVVSPEDPAGAIGAWLTDPDAAAWWLSGVFGEPVASAALAGGTGPVRVEVEWGESAAPLRRMAMGLWLHRWWPSHSEGIPRLDERLLRAEIGTAALNAEPCLPDQELASSLLGAGAAALPGALLAVNDLVGVRLEEAERLVWEAVHAVLAEGEIDADTAVILTGLAAQRGRDDARVEAMLREAENALHRPPIAPAVALAAGEPSTDDAVGRGTGDWLQVNPRHVSGGDGNVVVEESPEGDLMRLLILVGRGDETNEAGLQARIYLADEPIPVAQVVLVPEDMVYVGEVTIPTGVTYRIDVFDPELVSAPRFDGTPKADRDLVRDIISSRLTSPTSGPLGPFLCELLATDT